MAILCAFEAGSLLQSGAAVLVNAAARGSKVDRIDTTMNFADSGIQSNGFGIERGEVE